MLRRPELWCGIVAVAFGAAACEKKSKEGAAVASKAPALAPATGPAQAPVASPTTQPSTKAQPAAPAAKGVETFGEKIQKTDALPIATVLAAPDAYAGKVLLVDAKVRTVCQRKGCWMEVAPSTDKTSQGCRITFKNYGFFVPKDAAGSDVRVEGTLAVKKLSKDDVAHYESEGARFAKKAADGTAHEVRIVASGVELRRN
jgi:hypothetical protein